MATVELNKDNFSEIITGNDVVVVDFWAPWCGPCKSFAPTYEAVSEKIPGVVFAKVNTEEEQELAHHFQIRSIPTLMIFREQVIIFSEPGALPGPALEGILEQAQGLDMTEVHKQIAEEAQQQD
ncbi:MAG: thioredoxin [Gammaproteobacteria bacterium]|nr:thioredoxin [Gammaproteobacteria bacterium]MBU1731853.1 thioredoxin [Gammaproteobacteria bacterium]MBU1892464.1 thioredoxin [Gammaproteobacteria bacterium]